jgi:hypothetical protein
MKRRKERHSLSLLLYLTGKNLQLFPGSQVG